MNTFKSYNQGFTIIETLVAITILLISIAGPLTIAQKSLTAATLAKDQVIASYLAQDLMEYIKNTRDNNPIFSGAPSSFATQFCVSITNCTSLRLNTLSDGSYTTNAGTPTRFSRFATINLTNPNEATIRVTVTWQSGPIQGSATIDNTLFNVKL
jgi:prepilin-type N-terminal cleavage/methylation domain-containing protein